MKKSKILLIVAGVLLVCGSPYLTPVKAEEPLRLSCSAQLFDIFQKQTIDAFKETSGINVELAVASSEAALYRLYNGVSDVAGTAERIYFPKGEYGYIETEICSAPIVVITHPKAPITTITKEQLRDVFHGHITNWKDLGGTDLEIIVVVPDKGTAAFKNFSNLALKRFDISYTIMTHRSTMVVEVVKHIPGSISFITKGANSRDAGIKILKVEGVAHNDEAYPYQQRFSLVTKGRPQGQAKAFVDFLVSEKIGAMLRENGILPIVP